MTGVPAPVARSLAGAAALRLRSEPVAVDDDRIGGFDEDQRTAARLVAACVGVPGWRAGHDITFVDGGVSEMRAGRLAILLPDAHGLGALGGSLGALHL